MEKYTIVFEFKGGTYISQYHASNIKEAVLLWAKNSDNGSIPNISIIEKQQIYNSLLEDEPTSLSGIENVWCNFFRIKRKGYLINTILTK